MNKKAISLFSGAGGDSLGIKKAGFDLVAYSEFDKMAVKTHDLNFPKSEWLGEDVMGDITQIKDEEFSNFKGEIDLIFAGFPCQGFSHAGKKMIFDPRNQLFREFVRAVKLIEPEFIIGENVKGLLERKKDGPSFADEINEEFKKIGYKMIDPLLIKTEEFGIPQLRRRVFFIGAKNHNKLNNFDLAKEKIIGLRKIITSTLENAVKINLNDFPFLKESFSKNELTYIETNEDVTGKPHPFLLRKIKSGEISFNVRKSPHHIQVLNLDKPAKTIHGGYVFQPRLFILLRKNEIFYMRELTISELQQIQGFPKSYKFVDKRAYAVKQIGNAVPPKIATIIIKELFKE